MYYLLTLLLQITNKFYFGNTLKFDSFESLDVIAYLIVPVPFVTPTCAPSGAVESFAPFLTTGAELNLNSSSKWLKSMSRINLSSSIRYLFV
jgi:hypothetical protein